jgi:TolA-binding protein
LILIPLFLILLLSATAIIVVGCHPYYNTFYNAEEAYTIAWRDHKKLMRVFPDSLVVTPTEKMAAKYDRAVEKSLKMMEVYPRDKKHQDRAHYLMGRAAFYKRDFPVAVERMYDLQTLYPNSRLVPVSRIYVAKAHIMMDNLGLAEEILTELLKNYPELDKNQEITLLLVEIALRRGGHSQALGLLEGISGLSSLPLEKRLDIILKMADLNYELRQYERALGLLRAAPRSKRHPYLMFRVDRSIYFCLDAVGSLDEALAHLTVMRKNRAYSKQKYEIMYYTARVLRRLGRMDEAMALLEEINDMCSGVLEKGAGKADTMSLCGRASYELALIYEGQGDLDLAEAEFGEASKFGTASVGGRAAARFAALKKLRELRVPDSTGKVPAAARYSAAEIFRFELESPDSAYIYYLELSADTAADSTYRPRSLLAAAFTARDGLKNEALADSLLRVVAAEYGATEYARRAQIELDVEVTVVTRQELAERDFRVAEAMMERNPVEAVKAFYGVYQQYPDLDIAPKSLFAAAWYTDNTLHKNRAALTLYEELCAKYPESAYCKVNAAPRVAVARDSIEVRKRRRQAAGGGEGAAIELDEVNEADSGRSKSAEPGGSSR